MLFSPYVISPAEFEMMWPYGLAGLVVALILVLVINNIEDKEKERN